MKRDKTVIGCGALSLAVVVLTFALGSCTQEPIGLSMPDDDGLEVRVAFPGSVATRTTTRGTEAGTSGENRLDRVTILVFNKEGTKLETVLSEDVRSSNSSLAISQPQWASKGTLIVSPIQNPSSPKKIFAVANWDKITFNKATYTEKELYKELTAINAVADINDSKAYPMLMSGSLEVGSLSSSAYSVTVNMERQASKIRTRFTIPVDVQNYHPQIEWQTHLMKITVVNVPNQSYVMNCSAIPDSYRLLNSVPIAVNDTKPGTSDQTFPAQKELKWSESVYINENPVIGTTSAHKAASTYIVMQLPYKNRKTGVVDMDNYYQLYINDRGSGESPHKVVRNTIYDFNVKILGMGLPIDNLVPDVNVDGQLTVLDWEKSEIGDVEAPNHYFNVDRTYIGFQSFETSFKSSISTDVPDWKLVDASGTTIFSYAESNTNPFYKNNVTYTISGNVSKATITVTKLASLINFPTQKMTFIAKNLKVPLTVAYDNGFIPNSVLKTAGWPNDKLPPNGLQIAKRGDKVLPSGVAIAYDPTRQWKTSNTATSGTANKGLGMGVSNTATMAGAEHPAAQCCRDMGEGWFLPSIEELKLIYNNQSVFGTSYSFNTTSYWSSTNTNGSSSWGIYFSTGNEFPNGTNTGNNRVRCVKAI